MAARVLLHRRAMAPLTATLLAGGVVLYPQAAHAEAPEGSSRSKKPIYDGFEALPQSPSPLLPPSQPTVPFSAATDAEAAAAAEVRSRGPTPTDRLAGQIRRARLFLQRRAAAAEDGVNGAMDRAFHLERSFTDTVASLAPPRASGERLMPGLVYVLVAAMGGSILTRRSNVLLRAAVPAALGLGAGWAVIPITMRNCGDLAWRYEQRFPAVAQAHLQVRDGVERGLSFARVHTQVGRQYAEDKVHATREGVEDWVKKGK